MKINNEYTQWTPEFMQIGDRLRFLNKYYGSSKVMREIFTGHGANTDLEIHVNNLVLTYGISAVIGVCEQISGLTEVA